MSTGADRPRVASLAELYAIAYQIEMDAVDRYTLLAEQMEVHNNRELAGIFRDLARSEGVHAERILRLAGGPGVVGHAGEGVHWRGGESPEVADLADAHYIMTPRAALEMALAGERRALAFFTELLAAAVDPEVARVGGKLLEEESEHVRLCQRLLQRYPDPDLRRGDDPDPPVAQA